MTLAYSRLRCDSGGHRRGREGCGVPLRSRFHPAAAAGDRTSSAHVPFSRHVERGLSPVDVPREGRVIEPTRSALVLLMTVEGRGMSFHHMPRGRIRAGAVYMHHCGRFNKPALTRPELRGAASGFGSVAAAAAVGQGVRVVGRLGRARGVVPPVAGGSGMTPRADTSRRGEEHHLPLHGRRAVAGRHVRPKSRLTAGEAVQDEDGADAVQRHRPRSPARGPSASTARAASR